LFLKPKVKRTQIVTQMEPGRRMLTLPKSEPAKPRKITVRDQAADFPGQIPRPAVECYFVHNRRRGELKPIARCPDKNIGG
jgi:hypothetical protein